jgi:hypothetical protein
VDWARERGIRFGFFEGDFSNRSQSYAGVGGGGVGLGDGGSGLAANNYAGRVGMNVAW